MFVEQENLVVGRRGVVLLKVPAGSRAKVCLQSLEVEVVQTHWFGRQFLCPGWDCPACGVYAARVGVFQLAVVQRGPEWSPVLLELTAAEWARTRMLGDMTGLIPGPGVVCSLSRGSARSAVRCQPVSRSDERSEFLSSRERLVDVLGLLFKLPGRVTEESVGAWCERVRPAVAEQLSRAIARVG